jgi:Domain of unknown function (DUF5979)
MDAQQPHRALHLRRFACWALLVGLVATPVAARVARQQMVSSSLNVVQFLQAAPTASVVVSVQTVGAEPAADQVYELLVSCVGANDRPIAAAGSTTGVLVLSLPKSGTRTLSATEFPGLTITDRCSVRTSGIEGAQVTYATSQPARADGSVPDPLPGVVQDGVFRSAIALADGRSIVATFTFVGDLIVTNRITGAPAATPASATITVRCANSGYLTSSRLGNGQSRLFTNIPAGSSCKVTTDQTAGVAFDDNSGDARDGLVTVNSTPARCWDLRTSTADCRATVTVSSTYSGADPLDAQPTQTQPSTTTAEQNRNDPATTAAPAAAAPVEEPAVLDESEETVAFTGLFVLIPQFF